MCRQVPELFYTRTLTKGLMLGQPSTAAVKPKALGSLGKHTHTHTMRSGVTASQGTSTMPSPSFWGTAEIHAVPMKMKMAHMALNFVQPHAFRMVRDGGITPGTNLLVRR